jgi:hypothetical protein
MECKEQKKNIKKAKAADIHYRTEKENPEIKIQIWKQ